MCGNKQIGVWEVSKITVAHIVHCLMGFCVRIMPPKVLFRSIIRGYLENILNRVDVWYPGNKWGK